MVQIYYADHGSVYIDGTEYKKSVKEISIGGGDRDFSTQYTFGDSFEEFDRQAPFTIEVTTVKEDNALFRYVGGGATDTTWPISYSGDTTNRPTALIKYVNYTGITSTGSAFMIVMSGAYGIGLEKSSDAEGFWEEKVTFKCLAKNYSEHWTGDTVASGLPTPVP